MIRTQCPESSISRGVKSLYERSTVCISFGFCVLQGLGGGDVFGFCVLQGLGDVVFENNVRARSGGSTDGTSTESLTLAIMRCIAAQNCIRSMFFSSSPIRINVKTRFKSFGAIPERRKNVRALFNGTDRSDPVSFVKYFS